MVDPLLAEQPVERFLRARAAIAQLPARPLVTLAWAQSKNGVITAHRGQPTAISCPESRRFTHLLRAAHDAILVGVGTLLADDPRLTVRLVPGDNPRAVILDSRLRTPPTARLLSSNGRHPHPLILHAPDAPLERVALLRDAGAEPVPVPTDGDGRLDLPLVLEELADRGVQTLMVEGGGEVLAAFVAAGLVDLYAVTIAPQQMSGYAPPFGWAPPAVAGGERFTVGRDTVIVASGR